MQSKLAYFRNFVHLSILSAEGVGFSHPFGISLITIKNEKNELRFDTKEVVDVLDDFVGLANALEAVTLVVEQFLADGE